jgi:hypothetical protein
MWDPQAFAFGKQGARPKSAKVVTLTALSGRNQALKWTYKYSHYL